MTETHKILVNSHEEFRNRVLSEITGTGHFVKTGADHSIGDKCIVKVCFEELPKGIPINCRVVWVRKPNRWNPNQPPGVGLVIDECDIERLEYLIKYVEISSKPIKKKEIGRYMIHNNKSTPQKIDNIKNKVPEHTKVRSKKKNSSQRDSDQAVNDLVKMIKAKKQIEAHDSAPRAPIRDTKPFIKSI